MQAMLDRQLADGAAGLSLGLVYPPSAYADAAELVALAETVQAHGKILAAHIRSYEAGLIASTDEFLDILRSARVPGLLSHLQSAGRPNWGNVPRAIERLEAARRRRHGCELRHVSLSGRQQLCVATTAARGAGRRPGGIAGATARSGRPRGVARGWWRKAAPTRMPRNPRSC